MNDWTIGASGLDGIDGEARRQLGGLKPVVLRKGHVLFRPGEPVSGFVIVLSGRVGVYLLGASGRELLLYSVAPGETCVQTTLGLLGGELYAGEAIAETDLSVVVVPKTMFMALMAVSEVFRGFVFRALGDRMQTVMHLLELVAFATIESRLVHALLARADEGCVNATHQNLATSIGSSREVVSRHLEALARRDLIALDRGAISLLDVNGLRNLAAKEETR